jgi:hypothetical protein
MIKNSCILLFVFFSISITNAQETFVRKYTNCISKIGEKLGDWEEIDLTVVFNEKNTNNVVLYYPNKTKTLYKIGNVKTSKTVDGDEYQLIDCIDEEGNKLSLQLFSEVMRIIFSGGYVEFHE